MDILIVSGVQKKKQAGCWTAEPGTKHLVHEIGEGINTHHMTVAGKAPSTVTTKTWLINPSCYLDIKSQMCHPEEAFVATEGSLTS